MDKKTGIILGVIGAIVAVLIAVVFVVDAKTERLDKNTIMTVEDEAYTIEEFEMFSKIYNHEESGDINRSMNEDETLSMLDNFLITKIYYDAAKKHDIKLESGDTQNFETNYEKDASTYSKSNVTKEYYNQYQTEKAMVDKLKMNLDEYYELPDDMYESFKTALMEQGLDKSYSFRLMSIPYEAPVSGDESGDVSGDTADIVEPETDESGDKEDLSRETQLKVAEDVLAKIKSGDDFEELAKEYGSTRFTYVGSQLTFVNGTLEYATSPTLEGKLNNKKVYDAALEMKSGDISEIIEDEEYTSFNILKMESVEDGYVGEAEKELKSILLNQYSNDVVARNVHYEMNQTAYVRLLYK